MRRKLDYYLDSLDLLFQYLELIARLVLLYYISIVDDRHSLPDFDVSKIWPKSFVLCKGVKSILLKDGLRPFFQQLLF